MENELINETTWWQRNKKWFIPVVLLLLAGMAFLFSGNKYMGDFAQAYTDMPLFENALEKVKDNKEALQLLGAIKPIDKMAIAEGAVEYSDDKNNITATVTIKGSKTKAKMDIIANRQGSGWSYSLLKVRTKKPVQEIVILKD
jgi:ABC-type uncharacterized transport system fused permease/ATPase subunit